MIKYDLYDDMLNQVHLLIAGATGSGKSVAENGMIYTLLLYPPREKQLILIDPKRVELIEYKNLPHTLYYASEPADIVNALKYAVDIMETRYKQMQLDGLKMYEGSDIYIIIDEYADLITTNKKVIEPMIKRIGQVGRAGRIHLCILTQCPLKTIIDTPIKVNIDARLGLRTRSKQDSINIIGRAGLETLPKYGQGVYMTPNEFTLYNIPYISDADRHELINKWIDATRPRSAPKKHSFLSWLF